MCQFLEVPYDSQMNRTKDRVLVRGNLTPVLYFQNFFKLFIKFIY